MRVMNHQNNHSWPYNKTKTRQNCDNYTGSTWVQLLRASKWGQKLFLYSAVKACMFNFHFCWTGLLSKLSSTPFGAKLNKQTSGILIACISICGGSERTRRLLNVKLNIFRVFRRKMPPRPVCMVTNRVLYASSTQIDQIYSLFVFARDG